ncbi:hypothetical protein BX600DRAFT_441080 [Xylariales sp. PMI_506]|nr:hypothetical protein BX600DRAFT_441080 [Xylariales sp. PMI_506]
MAFSMKLSDACSSVKLDNWDSNILIFEAIRNDGTKTEPQKFDLNQVLGVDANGHFAWGGKNFSKRAQAGSIKLEQSHVLSAKLKVGGTAGLYAPVVFNLDQNLKIRDGNLLVENLPVTIAIKENEAIEEAARQLAEKLKKNPELQIGKVEKNGAAFWRVGLGSEINDDDEIFTTVSEEFTLIFLKAFDNSGRKIETLDVEMLKLKAGVEIGYVHGLPVPIPTYIGAEAGVSLFVAKASVFDIEFGISGGVHLGWKEASLEADFAGCGVVIGRRIGIAFGGAKVAIDLGRFFD